jgi:hypothetical protein
MAIAQYNPATSVTLMGLSTDPKPTNMPPGTRFFETDTGNNFMFYNTREWVMQQGTGSPATSSEPSSEPSSASS